MVLHLGDCATILKSIQTNSVDAVVTDPPYGLAFMGKHWDYDVPSISLWIEIIRVLKPGGHLLSFGGTRTYHRMVCNIEDAGFEIRDQVQWIYGSGFPKSLDISKAIDKAAPTTDAAKQWAGFGTALKPANEPILLARKPLSESTVAKNVLKWGTGGINVDGCRIPGNSYGEYANNLKESNTQGRFPANIIFSHAPTCDDRACDMFECAVSMLDKQSGVLTSGKFNQASKTATNNIYGKHDEYLMPKQYEASAGGASRFFYCAKTSKAERNAGLEGCEEKITSDGREKTIDNPYLRGETTRLNHHPTVKPIKLMTYLCRLITPPNGVVLDPFMGSGSTGIAALKEGFDFIGIEKESEYFEIAKRRVNETRRLKR